MIKVIYPGGTKDITIPTGQKISVSCKHGTAVVFYSTFPLSVPENYYEHDRVTNEETVYGAFAADKHVRIEAKTEEVYYVVEDNPSIIEDISITRSTIANAGTITAVQHQGLCLYQDASTISVTMTTLTGTQLAAAFHDVAIGESVSQYVASNHATNTSTISGGVGVTLVGSGAVTNTGGHFLLIKTAATTFDLVRVG